MKDAHAIMRRARWSELVFAVAALCLTMGLPVPPPDLDRWLILGSWCVMVVVALVLVVALRRPSRPVWSVALGLSAYFCANVLAGLVAWLATLRSLSYRVPGPGAVLSQIVFAIVILAQFDVAVRCWRTRALWTERPVRPDEAPVG